RRLKIQNEEGHSARRWRGNASFPAHQDRLQTAPADIRQADDLLPAGDFDARRSSRSAHHLDAKRFADAARLFGRWNATRYSHRVRRATKAARDRARIFNRREICRRLGRIAYPW